MDEILVSREADGIVLKDRSADLFCKCWNCPRDRRLFAGFWSQTSLRSPTGRSGWWCRSIATQNSGSLALTDPMYEQGKLQPIGNVQLVEYR